MHHKAATSYRFELCRQAVHRTWLPAAVYQFLWRLLPPVWKKKCTDCSYLVLVFWRKEHSLICFVFQFMCAMWPWKSYAICSTSLLVTFNLFICCVVVMLQTFVMLKPLKFHARTEFNDSCMIHKCLLFLRLRGFWGNVRLFIPRLRIFFKIGD